MNEIRSKILENFPFSDPYVAFDPSSFQPDVKTDATPEMLDLFKNMFAQLIKHANPGLIVEVGSWKGGSAIEMAQMLKNDKRDGLVLCIDTWLGTLGSMTLPENHMWSIRKYYVHGYPTLYHQFLANIVHHGLQDYVLPFPNTSRMGSLWLKEVKVQADIIYLDASHEEDDVYEDIKNYWGIVRPGGFLVGDDWHMGGIGVICAVNRYSREMSLKYQTAGNKWIIQKGV